MHQTIGAFLPDMYIKDGLTYLVIYFPIWWFVWLVWFSSSWFKHVKNISFMLSCLYFQALAPDDLCGCGLICYPLILSEAPSVFPQTRIQTTAMTHHSNNSVRDHMKWVSGSLFISRITIMMPVHFSVTMTPLSTLSFLTPCLREECSNHLFLLWHDVCIARLGCWAARRCCLAWPSCKPITSRAKRGWHHHWVKGTGPVLRANKPTRSTATTITGTRLTTDKPITVTWATHQLGAVHLW